VSETDQHRRFQQTGSARGENRRAEAVEGAGQAAQLTLDMGPMHAQRDRRNQAALCSRSSKAADGGVANLARHK